MFKIPNFGIEVIYRLTKIKVSKRIKKRYYKRIVKEIYNSSSRITMLR